MATATRLMTVEEFSNLPEDQGPEYSELHGGEIVKVVRQKLSISEYSEIFGGCSKKQLA